MFVVLGLLLVVPIGAFLLVAVSPKLFVQGTSWLTLAPFGQAFSGAALAALGRTAVCGVGAALLATLCGLPLAMLVHRTNLVGRRIWSVGIWALLLSPSYLVAIGWERLFEPAGVLDHAGQLLTGVATFGRGPLYGPGGIILIDGLKGVPFAYLAISAALPGLGSSFEQAARAHGAGRLGALRVIVPILAPALWTALAIVFAETISDYGVAATLGYDAHYFLSTWSLYNAVYSIPISFPLAASIGVTLVALAGIALLAQRRAINGRTYRVLSGRTRPHTRHQFGRRGQILCGSAVTLFFLVALGVPVLGAVSASLLSSDGTIFGGFHLTLNYYAQVFSDGALITPLLYSLKLALICATVVTLLSVPVARLLTRGGTGRVGRVLDLVLLGAVALPSLVMAAGYILIYNLPVMHSVGLSLYGTTLLLGIAYVAGGLPNNARILIGPLSQLDDGLLLSARSHGASAARTWRTVGVPVLSRYIVWVWLYCFAGTFFELPISEFLYPAGKFPLSVMINKELANYHYSEGTAMEVVAVLGSLMIVALVLGLYRLLVPHGWRQVGATRP
ncbi:MAG TPA: ABC transporter permease subunit [Solirubrobacteraceae bacterium]|nr:ABC transporter permease subunit [Solirubrobacteraceae bacterium]